MVGVPEDDDAPLPLRYLGRVGTGFTAAELARLAALMEELATTDNPFSSAKEPMARFVRPVLRCRVEYRELTPDGVMRHPSYKGLVEPRA